MNDTWPGPSAVLAAVSEAVQFEVYCVQAYVSFGVNEPQLKPPDERRLAEAVSAGVPEAALAQKES